MTHHRSSWLVLLALTPTLTVGCAGGKGGAYPRGTLPFVVRVNGIEPEGVHSEGVTPPSFPTDLTTRLADTISDCGLFTAVTTDPDQSDLELEVSIGGSDFGPGTIDVGGAILSTAVWLTAGQFSWLIENRRYPDSDVFMVVTIKSAESVIFRDTLSLRDLELNLWERADVGDMFLNIFLPPCWVDGNDDYAGRSLSLKGLEYFAQEEPRRILSSLVRDHYRHLDCFLVHDAERRQVIVVSKKTVYALEVAGSGESPVLPVSDKDKKDKLRLYVSQQTGGFNGDPDDLVYTLPLHPDETEPVRVTAHLKGPATAQWTICLPPGPVAAEPTEVASPGFSPGFEARRRRSR